MPGLDPTSRRTATPPPGAGAGSAPPRAGSGDRAAPASTPACRPRPGTGRRAALSKVLPQVETDLVAFGREADLEHQEEPGVVLAAQAGAGAPLRRAVEQLPDLAADLTGIDE